MKQVGVGIDPNSGLSEQGDWWGELLLIDYDPFLIKSIKFNQIYYYLCLFVI